MIMATPYQSQLFRVIAWLRAVLHYGYGLKFYGQRRVGISHTRTVPIFFGGSRYGAGTVEGRRLSNIQ